MNINNDAPFDFVDMYSRKDAIADGGQVEVTRLASKAGFRCPIFLTQGVYSQCVAVPEGAVTDEDKTERLLNLLIALRAAIFANGTEQVTFDLSVCEGGEGRAVNLIAVCGPLDIDDPKPALTIMLPEDE
jgi:hypothetical protein